LIVAVGEFCAAVDKSRSWTTCGMPDRVDFAVRELVS